MRGRCTIMAPYVLTGLSGGTDRLRKAAIPPWCTARTTATDHIGLPDQLRFAPVERHFGQIRTGSASNWAIQTTYLSQYATVASSTRTLKASNRDENHPPEAQNHVSRTHPWHEIGHDVCQFVPIPCRFLGRPTSWRRAPRGRIRRRRNRRPRSWSSRRSPPAASARRSAGRIPARFPRRPGWCRS